MHKTSKNDALLRLVNLNNFSEAPIIKKAKIHEKYHYLFNTVYNTTKVIIIDNESMSHTLIIQNSLYLSLKVADSQHKNSSTNKNPNKEQTIRLTVISKTPLFFIKSKNT